MQFIYATGQPRNMEFAIASNTDAVPADATILATCTPEHEEEHLDDHTFATMTDAEFYSFRRLVQVARRMETQRAERAERAATARASASVFLPATLCARFVELVMG